MRTIILGMNNPSGRGDPLSPDDGAGKALFKMSGMIREVYEARFERRNLVDGTEWSDRGARTKARLFKSALLSAPPTTIVVLGKSVAKALELRFDEFFSSTWTNSSRFILVPHPSGRNLLYNKKKVRERLRLLLASL